MRSAPRFFFVFAFLCLAASAPAQVFSQRGFVEARATLFPQSAVNDPEHAVGDLLLREELFAKPTRWLQVAAGFDLRGNTHGQVVRLSAPDVGDRTARRPVWSMRRLSATLHYRRVTVDVGKQFIRWGKADIVTPTDHFAPRDFLNVIDTEYLAVTGAHAFAQAGGETFELVVVPRFTPSRLPLLNQRWAAAPPGAAGITLVDGGARLPAGTQTGVRWSHVGAGFEYALSYFDGFNHLPNIDVHVPFVPGALILTRVYPTLRSYGVDAAAPTRWFTIKGEAAYSTSSTPGTDEYVLYVLQLERMAGEWVFVGGYAGEAVTARRAPLAFAPDRGLTRSLIGRASYTTDVNRSAAVEGAVRQNGDGGYLKAEYSQARGQHWRATIDGSIIAGRDDDYLGQYRRNSYLAAALRYSF